MRLLLPPTIWWSKFLKISKVETIRVGAGQLRVAPPAASAKMMRLPAAPDPQLWLPCVKLWDLSLPVYLVYYSASWGARFKFLKSFEPWFSCLGPKFLVTLIWDSLVKTPHRPAHWLVQPIDTKYWRSSIKLVMLWKVQLHGVQLSIFQWQMFQPSRSQCIHISIILWFGTQYICRVTWVWMYTWNMVFFSC
jgi:hypothetical protein